MTDTGFLISFAEWKLGTRSNLTMNTIIIIHIIQLRIKTIYILAPPPRFALFPRLGILVLQISMWLAPSPSSGIYLNIPVSVSVFLISLKKTFQTLLSPQFLSSFLALFFFMEMTNITCTVFYFFVYSLSTWTIM